MASGWTTSKRSGVAAVALILLSACTPRYGWQAEVADETVVVSRDTDTVSLTFQLDDGYEAAPDFTQRVTLQHPGDTVELSVATLEEAFPLPLPPETEEAELSFVIGFCEATRKDLCFVEQATVTIRRGESTPPTSENGVFSLTYRPEPPSF